MCKTMTKMMNSLFEQIKKITLKSAISWFLLFAGIAFLTVAFCSTPTAVNVDASTDATFMSFTKSEWLYIAYVYVLFFVGNICIWIGIKVNPEPFIKVLRENTEDDPRAEIHNYSTDFAEVCTQLDHQCTMQRVDNLIELIESEDK